MRAVARVVRARGLLRPQQQALVFVAEEFADRTISSSSSSSSTSSSPSSFVADDVYSLRRALETFRGFATSAANASVAG